MELEATWGRATKVWWSYLWRNLIALLAAVIIGAILGFILGFIMAMIGLNKETIQMVVAPIGFIVGLGISIVPIKLILNKNFGEFRLVLIKNNVRESV